MDGVTIWIEAEAWAAGEWNEDDANADVIVTLADGSRWVATFVTYANVRSLTLKNRQTGEQLAGAYFWVSHMVLIDMLSRSRIEQVIADLLSTDHFPLIFARIPDDADAQHTADLLE